MASNQEEQQQQSAPVGNQAAGGKQQANGRAPEQPIMVARNKSGVVKWFSFKNGYGFITVDGDNGDADDIFVHRSEFIREGAREVFYHVDVGDRLEFDIINRAKGREAVAVTGPNGVRIPGSPANYGRGRRQRVNSDRPPRGGNNQQNQQDEFVDAPEAPNGDNKKKGGRGGRRRNASADEPQGGGAETNGNDKAGGGGRRRGGGGNQRKNRNSKTGGEEQQQQQGGGEVSEQ